MKVTTPAERKKIISMMIAKQNKEAKHKVLGYADELANRYMLRRPSGIMPLDIQTAGGLPAATSNTIAGPESAGKTRLMYEYMRMNQRIHKANSAIGIAPVEHPFDHMYCRYKGLMVVVPDGRIEQEQEFRKSMGWPQLTKDEIKFLKQGIGEVVPVVGNNMEEMLNQILQMVKTNVFQLIGIDSITAAMPEDLEGKDLDDGQMKGRHAKVIADFYRKYAPYTSGFDGDDDGDKSDTTIIMTQQVRSNPKKSEAAPFIQKFLKDWDASGSSYAGKHGKFIEITLWSGSKIKQGGKEDKVQTGKLINWEITKGKGGCHEGMTGEFEYDFNNGVNMQAIVLSSGLIHGTLLEQNGLIHVMDPLTKKPHPKFEAKPAMEFMGYLADNWDAEEYVRKATVYAATGQPCLYR
jgi:RecA/RadA recombinase